MELTDAQITRWIAQYFWPFCRIGAFFLALPLIGTRSVPMNVRLILALAITVLVAPLLAPMPAIQLMSLTSFLMVAQQLLIGFALGFLVQVLFQLFIVGGQLVAMQNGLGFSSMIDPTNGLSVTSVSQIYLMTVNLIFFAVDGHLALFQLIVESFQSLPVGTTGISPDSMYDIVLTGSWMFENAVLLALPAVIALLIVNVAFGVMSRVAPQLNIMSVGFPLNMVTGALIIWITLGSVLPLFDRTMDEILDLLKEVATLNG